MTVDATKAGFTAAVQAARTLAVDLTAPAATWTPPATLQVGVAIDAVTPVTDDTDIASWAASGLPPGLAIDAGTGALSGTPTAANAATATATATVTDRAGNPGTADIAFPAVAKGTQDLSAFAYAAATVTYGDLAPTVIAPTGVPTTLSYAATPATVCTVDSSTGELTIQGAGICTITATAALDANYDEGTATATVTVEPAGTLTLNLDPIATDNTVNFAEQELGFIISGDTGSEGGVSVTVRVGTEELTDTSSATSTPAAWSVIVLARSAYLTDSNVTVTVSASKTGFTSPGDLTRTVTVDLTAPTAPTYTAPAALKVGEAITAMSPSGGTDVDGYSATGLPSGLTIDAGTGVIRGTPDMAADAASTTVTVTDRAGNPATATIAFPAVAKGTQDLSAFAYAAATATHGADAPALTAPDGARTTLSYTAAPAAVCTVDSATGALTLVGLGACTITATAAASDDYNEATATFTVTVEAAGALALTVGAIAGDGTVNIAEKTAGFTISGDTGPIGGAAVTVTVGGTALSATSADADPATWSVTVPADAGYIVEGDLSVTVDATKAGFTAAVQAARTLAVDLTAPAATWTPPATLKVGAAIDAVTPVTADTDIETWEATGLPPGLAIDTGTGALSGTPTAANAATATATATVTDTAGNPATVDIAFPAVAKGTQDLSAFAYAAATATHGADAPAPIIPDGARTTLSYTAAPAAVCTVDSGTGALTLVGLGACTITATAAASDDYDEATATFTVTVEAAGALALNVDDIAGDGTVNIAEKDGRVHDLGRHRPDRRRRRHRDRRLDGADGDLGRRRPGDLVGDGARRCRPRRRGRDRHGRRHQGRLHRRGPGRAHAHGRPDRPDGDLDAARHAQGRRGHRRRDPGHRRHRHRDVGGHRPAAGARHRRRDRRPLRHADGGQRRHRHRHGDGDRQAGNPATADIAFPAVSKGTQDLSAFAYAAATATHGADAPALMAPEGRARPSATRRRRRRCAPSIAPPARSPSSDWAPARSPPPRRRATTTTRPPPPSPSPSRRRAPWRSPSAPSPATARSTSPRRRPGSRSRATPARSAAPPSP